MVQKQHLSLGIQMFLTLIQCCLYRWLGLFDSFKRQKKVEPLERAEIAFNSPQKKNLKKNKKKHDLPLFFL